MKTKMTVLVFLLVFLIMSATAVSALFYFEQRFRRNIFREQYALLDAIAVQIDNTIFDALVHLDDMADAVSPDMLARPEKAQQFLDANSHELRFFDNSLFLFSGSGRLVAATPRELNLIGKDYSFRGYFRQTLATGKLFISEPFFSAQKSTHPVIMFTSPVYHGGKMIAVLGGSIDLASNHYLRSLAALKLGQTGYLSLYDATRTVLMHPDRSRVTGREPAGTNAMVDKALGGFEGTGETVTEKGAPVLRSVKGLKSTGWVLAISYPLKDVYAPLHEARRYFLAGGLVAALLSAFIIWPLMRYLTAPLQAFARHMERLPSLKGEERLFPETSDDEIGVLSRTFNRMMAELEKRKDALKAERVDLKAAQSQLALSRDFYLTLFENFPALIWRSGVDGRCDYFNRTWLDFTGRTMEEEIGDGWAAGVHPEDYERCLSTYREAFLARTPFTMEYRLRRFDGEYRWINDIGRPFDDTSGSFAGYIGTCLDVTETKEFEEVLRLSEERYRNIVEGVGDIIFSLSPAGIFTSVNRAAGKVLGWAQEDMLGKPFTPFIHPEDLPLAEGLLHACLREETRPSCELRVRTRSAGYVTLEVLSTPLVRDRQVSCVMGIARDISDRKRVEESLRKLSLAIEQSPVSVVITDAEATIEYVNPKFTQVTGYDPEEVLGQNPRILKSDETPAEVYERMWGELSAGRVWSGVLRNRKKSGELFWELATISPVKDREEVTTHFVAIKEDITERRRLEEQLRHSQKMEAVGTLAGGIAHDFNNILTAIVGYATLLQRKVERDEALRRKTDQILVACDRAAALTKGLLAYSRKQITRPVPTELNGIVADLERLLLRLVPENITCKSSLGEDELTVFADPGQLEQVLMNLVVNARDAIEGKGSILITTGRTVLDPAYVRSHGYGNPGPYALLTVSDTGVGMDEKTRERIFEPFFTTKEVGKGTGLGLAMVYGIVKQHEGYINCYSEPGHGTTFKIYLPLVEEAAEGEGRAYAEREVVRGGGETILLAEDDTDVRTLMGEGLEEYGYTVIRALDGEDAVDRFREHQEEIGLVILDVIMPKMNGREAYEEIRRMRPGTKAILTSGYTAEILDPDGMNMDGVEFVSKPIVIDRLLMKIREVLDR